MVRSAAGGGGSSSMMGCSPWAATTTTQSEIEGDIQKACSIMMQEEELHKLCAEKKASEERGKALQRAFAMQHCSCEAIRTEDTAVESQLHGLV